MPSEHRNGIVQEFIARCEARIDVIEAAVIESDAVCLRHVRVASRIRSEMRDDAFGMNTVDRLMLCRITMSRSRVLGGGNNGLVQPPALRILDERALEGWCEAATRKITDVGTRAESADPNRKDTPMIDSELLAPYPALTSANPQAKEILVAFMRRIFDEFGVSPTRPTSRGGAYYKDPAPFLTILSATRLDRKVNVAIAFKATPAELADLPLRAVAYQRGVYAYLNISSLDQVDVAMAAATRAWRNMLEQSARRCR